MKKITLYIFMVLCCLSCKIEGGNPEYYFGAQYLTAYTWDAMENSLGEANRTFGILQCAEKYLSYTGDDRDLQWFSNYVKATKTDNVIKIKASGREMLAVTNGMGFDEPGAIYEVNGFTFHCTSDNKWTVENEKMDSEVEILASEALGLTYKWDGQGIDKNKSGDIRADYDFNIIFDWKYANNPIRIFFSSNNDGKRGYFNFSISRNGKEADWVKCKIQDTKTEIQTSRD